MLKPVPVSHMWIKLTTYKINIPKLSVMLPVLPVKPEGDDRSILSSSFMSQAVLLETNLEVNCHGGRGAENRSIVESVLLGLTDLSLSRVRVLKPEKSSPNCEARKLYVVHELKHYLLQPTRLTVARACEALDDAASRPADCLSRIRPQMAAVFRDLPPEHKGKDWSRIFSVSSNVEVNVDSCNLTIGTSDVLVLQMVAEHWKAKSGASKADSDTQTHGSPEVTGTRLPELCGDVSLFCYEYQESVLLSDTLEEGDPEGIANFWVRMARARLARADLAHVGCTVQDLEEAQEQMLHEFKNYVFCQNQWKRFVRPLLGWDACVSDTPHLTQRHTRARARTHARRFLPALLHAHASATAVLTAAARPHHTHSHSSHSMSPQRELSLAVLALRNARPGSHSNPTQLASFLHSSAFDSTQDCLQAVGPQGLSLSLAKTPTGKRRALGQVHAV